jgi:hypothetical protein
MKEFHGQLYETMASWYPVIINQTGVFLTDFIHRSAWLDKHCPNGPDDYDAYVYHDDNLTDPNHRSVYFFRDKHVALLFALRWA